MKKGKTGFTLAEILVTLAVIGIVATMTIPNLVQNYQSKAWSTASKVFDKKLTEALKIMNTQGTLAGYSRTEDFVNELSKHLKITKTCTNNLTSCFEKEVTVDGKTTKIKDTQTAQDLGKNWGTNVVGFQLANGVNGLLAYNPDCTQNEYSNQITGSDCLGVVYDTSAYAKPNEHLKDIRTNGNVNKLGDEWICLRFADKCWSEPFIPTAISQSECEANKTALGISNCPFANDYWAGAVKQCGGVGNMPTMAQLAKLVEQIYGESGIGAEEDKDGLTIKDQTLFDALHTKSPTASSSSFYIWSSEHPNSTNVYSRGFHSTSSTYFNVFNDDRDGNNNLALCISD